MYFPAVSIVRNSEFVVRHRCYISRGVSLLQVLTITIVLVSSNRAGADAPSAPCDISVEDTSNLTLNCSRRDIVKIPNWPEQINNISKGNASDFCVCIRCSYYGARFSTHF